MPIARWSSASYTHPSDRYLVLVGKSQVDDQIYRNKGYELLTGPKESSGHGFSEGYEAILQSTPELMNTFRLLIDLVDSRFRIRRRPARIRLWSSCEYRRQHQRLCSCGCGRMWKGSMDCWVAWLQFSGRSGVRCALFGQQAKTEIKAVIYHAN
jgi:hypothetical protein